MMCDVFIPHMCIIFQVCDFLSAQIGILVSASMQQVANFSFKFVGVIEKGNFLNGGVVG